MNNIGNSDIQVRSSQNSTSMRERATNRARRDNSQSGPTSSQGQQQVADQNNVQRQGAGPLRSQASREGEDMMGVHNSHHHQSHMSKSSNMGHSVNDANNASNHNNNGGRASGDRHSQSKQQPQNRSASSASTAVHEGIIDLYLQVKIRSNDEIDMFESDQLAKERERLARLDSLTVLDYIRTSIEILMQMKLEDDKDQNGNDKTAKPTGFGGANGGDNGTASEFTSTFQSLDLPPKEYEQQLQQYESEVRNHIKVEQQLKLHIEVLQEKIDDLEREKEKNEKQLQSELEKNERRLKEQFSKQQDQKQAEVDRLQKELRKAREYVNASLERGASGRAQGGASAGIQGGSVVGGVEKAGASQVKVVRVNNFIQGGGGTSTNGKAIRTNAQSHSPSGLAGGSSKDSQGSVRTKLKKGLKVVSQPGKSPYLNGSFNNNQMHNVMTQQSSTTSTNNGANDSQSSGKSIRKGGAASADIADSSVVVLKQSSTASGTSTQTAVTTHQAISSTSQSANTGQQSQSNSNQSVQQQPMQAVDNMKLLAAIQRMRQVNPGGATQIQSKSSTSASGKSMKIVNLNQNKTKTQQVGGGGQSCSSGGQGNNGGQDPQSVLHKKTKSSNMDGKARAQTHYTSVGSEQQNLHHTDSDASQQTVIGVHGNNNGGQHINQHNQTDPNSVVDFNGTNHQGSLDGTSKMNLSQTVRQNDLNVSGNFNASLKQHSGNINLPQNQGKSSVRSSAQRQNPNDSDLQGKTLKDPPATVVPSQKAKVTRSKREPITSSVLSKGKIVESGAGVQGGSKGLSTQEIRSATNAQQVQRKKINQPQDAMAHTSGLPMSGVDQSLLNQQTSLSGRGVGMAATSQGGALSGEASEEFMQRMMLEQDAQISLNQSSGAMHTAANQQDFIHQFQHQLHGYHTRQGQALNPMSQSNNMVDPSSQPGSSSHTSHAMEMHPGTSTSSQSKQSRTMASGMPSQQLVAQQQQQQMQGQQYAPQSQNKMISPGSSGVQQMIQGGHDNVVGEGVVMMEKQQQQYKQSSVPAAARVRPRSQTGQQVQQKNNNMMF